MGCIFLLWFLCYYIVLRFFSENHHCATKSEQTLATATLLLYHQPQCWPRGAGSTKHSQTNETRGSCSWPESSHGNLAACPRRDGANRRASSHIGGDLRGRHSWCFGGRLLPQRRHAAEVNEIVSGEIVVTGR